MRVSLFCARCRAFRLVPLLAAAVALQAVDATGQQRWTPYILDVSPHSSAYLLPDRATGCPPFRERSRSMDKDTWWQLTLSCRNRALAQARSASDLEAEAIALGELGLGYLGDDRKKGIDYTDEAILIVDRLGDNCWLSVLLRQRGSLIDQGSRAEFYRLAVAAARKDACHEEVALSLAYLVSSLPKDDPEAIEHLKAALDHARQAGSYETQVDILGRLARYRANQGDDRALLHFEEIVNLHRTAGDRRREMNTLWNIGVTHFVLGRPETGVPYLEQYIQFHREAGHSTTRAEERLEELRRRAGS